MENTVRPYRQRLADPVDRATKPSPLHEPRPGRSEQTNDDAIAAPMPSLPISASPDTMPTQPRLPLYVASQPRHERRRQPRALLAALAMVFLLVGLVSIGLGRGFTAAMSLVAPAGPGNATAQAADTGADRGAVGAIVEQTKPAPTVPAIIVPTPTVVAPTAVPPTLAMRYGQVAAAEMALQTGQFVTTVDYGSGTVSTSTVRFDLGTGGKPLRLSLRSEYRAMTGTRITERAINGGAMWERQSGAAWRIAKVQQDPRGEVTALLPQLAAVPESAVSGTDGVLRWRDTRRGAAMTLTYDPQTGVPLLLRQVSEATGLVISTTYQGWNAPVEVAVP